MSFTYMQEQEGQSVGGNRAQEHTCLTYTLLVIVGKKISWLVGGRGKCHPYLGDSKHCRNRIDSEDDVAQFDAHQDK